MKLVFFLVFILSSFFSALYAQVETIKQPGEEYIKYIYNPQTNSTNLSYDYSNKWDLDGDGRKDSLFFIGNSGAHTYFFLRIILSVDQKIRDFTFIQLDMPYLFESNPPKEINENNSFQFMPGDFDNNRTMDLYLNFNNSFSQLPKEWKKKGIKTKKVILSFNGINMKVRNPSR